MIYFTNILARLCMETMSDCDDRAAKHTVGPLMGMLTLGILLFPGGRM